ncbi:MAG: hypothetical protein LC768_18675 [Acidobacteria bacterium]|nr:hypothetical protein [Acidobacteriota bacterium]
MKIKFIASFTFLIAIFAFSSGEVLAQAGNFCSEEIRGHAFDFHGPVAALQPVVLSVEVEYNANTPEIAQKFFISA